MSDQLTIGTKDTQPLPTQELSGIGKTRMSASVNELFSALAKARAKFSTVKKENVNPFFKSKYADLSVVIDATFKSLSENGLSVVQLPSGVSEDGLVRVTTLVCHSSGQWLESEITMPVAKQDAQGIGSAITYARRYAYQSVLNVAAESDDDGNAAVSQEFKKTSPELHRKAVGQERITTSQAKAFRDAAKKNHSIEDVIAQLEKVNGYRNADEIQKQHYQDLLNWALKPKEEPHYEADGDLYSGDEVSKCFKHGEFKGAICPKCENEAA